MYVCVLVSCRSNQLILQTCNFKVPLWLSGRALVSANEVTLRRARLLLGWVTVSGVQLSVQGTYLSHPGNSAWPSLLGRPKEYQPKGRWCSAAGE